MLWERRCIELSDVYIHVYSYSGKGRQFIGNSPQGAIQGLGGGLHLYGKIMFGNYTGENGGAIGLLNNAHLYFYPYCNVSFEGNTAIPPMAVLCTYKEIQTYQSQSL